VTVVAGTVGVVTVGAGGAGGLEAMYAPARITTMSTTIMIAALVVDIAFL